MLGIIFSFLKLETNIILVSVKFVFCNMLLNLHIQNYAIIDSLSIRFENQLNIITGETGAGKSILVGALGLILGQRADTGVLQTKDKKCFVEATFVMPVSPALDNFFLLNDVDKSEEIIVRREIAANGKSRSFINDTPVNLTQLKQLSLLLVDMHQQFDTLELGSENFQREVIDALANNGKYLTELKEIYSAYVGAKNQLQQLQTQQANSQKELDYNQFLYDELDALALTDDELENLDAELKLLQNSEQIKQQLNAVYFELKDSDQPIVQQLKSLLNKLQAIEQFHNQLPELNNRIKSSVVELSDIADELSSIDQNIHHDEKRIQIVNDRLSTGYSLLKKHTVKTTVELLEIHSQLKNKLEDVVNIAEQIQQLENKTSESLQAAEKIAKVISKNRKAQLENFTEKVNQLLHQVGMPNAQIKVELQPTLLNMYGIDEISFLFDANKSNRFEPLQKVASGGELSRLMLCIKSLVAQKLALPTLIFDEIDSGISGEAAKQVGLIMKSLAENHQLIVISHQPQIAAKGNAHYFVYKKEINNKVVTNIRLLNQEERINAIAQMLGGEKPTETTFANAREMLVM